VATYGLLICIAIGSVAAQLAKINTTLKKGLKVADEEGVEDEKDEEEAPAEAEAADTQGGAEDDK